MGPRSMGKLCFAFSSVAVGRRCSACSTYTSGGSPCSQGVFTRKTDARTSDLYSLLGAWMYRPRYQCAFLFFLFSSSGGWVKIKLELPHFHVCIRYMCFDLTHAPVATTARAAATGLVSMSTRPDLEGSGTVVEIATRSQPSSSPGSVGLARAHPLTKTQAMKPSRQTWSSDDPPYPLGRWSSILLNKKGSNTCSSSS